MEKLTISMGQFLWLSNKLPDGTPIKIWMVYSIHVYFRHYIWLVYIMENSLDGLYLDGLFHGKPHRNNG